MGMRKIYVRNTKKRRAFILLFVQKRYLTPTIRIQIKIHIHIDIYRKTDTDTDTKKQIQLSLSKTVYNYVLQFYN